MEQKTGAALLPVLCGGLRCTDKGLQKIDGAQVLVSVARADIRRIVFRNGIQAPNPTIQILFGLALTSVAYLPIVHLIDWLQHGGTFFEMAAYLLPIPALGLWMVFTALKRGYFLAVETDRGQKRFAFRKRPSLQDLESFVSAVERGYGVSIIRET